MNNMYRVYSILFDQLEKHAYWVQYAQCLQYVCSPYSAYSVCVVYSMKSVYSVNSVYSMLSVYSIYTLHYTTLHYTPDILYSVYTLYTLYSVYSVYSM